MGTTAIYCTSCGAENGVGARFCFKCGAPMLIAEPSAPVRTSSDFITLSCPNCGGKLEITPDMERFACKFCGNEHLVRRTGSVVSLAPVVEGLKRVETKFDQVLTGSDRLAAEQTIQRLKVEIPELERQVAAKESQIQAIIPRGLLHRLAYGMIQLGSFGFALLIVTFILDKAGFFVGFPKIESFLQADGFMEKWTIAVVAALACILIGSLLDRASRVRKAVRSNSKHMSAYEKRIEQESAELARLKEELQQWKQQLEQLHRYTAER